MNTNALPDTTKYFKNTSSPSNIKNVGIPKIFCLLLATLSLSMPMIAQANACKWGRPSYDMRINRLQYNDEYYPFVTLSDNNEYTLSKGYGVDTTYGRAMLAMALTAITVNSTIDVCINSGDVTSITIKQ